MFDILVVGCGLSGIVIARELAEKGLKVKIVEKRNHIGGNIYDFYDENGILVQKYGPHVFFTDDASVEQYIRKYVPIDYFYAECKTYIAGKAIPMPFNFSSIDLIYENHDYADALKQKLIEEFGTGAIVSVVDVMNSKVKEIHEYGMYMYENEYRKYSAKQWGKPIEDIDPSVFMRVPVYISEKKEYMRQKYQFMPRGGFTNLADIMLNHANISVELNKDALENININSQNNIIKYGKFSGPIVYTGPLDALFSYKYGRLPYRALEFTWKTIPKYNAPDTPLSAYPEGDKYIRITDYTQFPPQNLLDKAVIAIEYPLEYKKDELCGNEPYYPTLTIESKNMFARYEQLGKEYRNLFPCGRLADFKYYNMDAVITRALGICQRIDASLNR